MRDPCFFLVAQADYDVLIKLSRDNIPYSDRHIEQPHLEQCYSDHMTCMDKDDIVLQESTLHKPTQKRKKRNKLKVPSVLVGFDPVGNYITQLEERFGRLAVFCYDEYGGDVLGIRWLPEMFIPKPLDPVNCIGYIPLTRKNKQVCVVPNVLSLVEEMSDLGQGLVQDIQIL